MKAENLLMALAMVLVLSLGATGAAAFDVGPESPGAAIFEGRVIDLREGWGDATACVAGDGENWTECFRSESELLDRVLEIGESSLTAEASAQLSTCSSSLRLYSGTGYSGQVLYVSQRGTWINLADYAFSNVTSSFNVGACSSYFADLANGGGDWYPTSSTQAWDQSSAMIGGWDNRVSSVYLT